MPIDPRPPLDLDVTRRLHTLLGSYMKDREANAILHILRDIVKDPDDGPKLSLLMQEWIRVS